MSEENNPANMTSLAETIATLEEHHEFPGAYMFKVIAFHTEDLERRVSRAAAKGMDDATAALNLRSRGSRNRRYTSVTLEPVVQDASQVLAIYEELRKIEGLIALI